MRPCAPPAPRHGRSCVPGRVGMSPFHRAPGLYAPATFQLPCDGRPSDAPPGRFRSASPAVRSSALNPTATDVLSLSAPLPAPT